MILYDIPLADVFELLAVTDRRQRKTHDQEQRHHDGGLKGWHRRHLRGARR